MSASYVMQYNHNEPKYNSNGTEYNLNEILSVPHTSHKKGLLRFWNFVHLYILMSTNNATNREHFTHTAALQCIQFTKTSAIGTEKTTKLFTQLPRSQFDTADKNSTQQSMTKTTKIVVRFFLSLLFSLATGQG